MSDHSINNKVLFKGRTLDSVEAMANYPWRIPEGIIYADILIDGKVLYKKYDHYSQWIKIDAITDNNGTFIRFDDPDYQYTSIFDYNDINNQLRYYLGKYFSNEEIDKILYSNATSKLFNERIKIPK